MTSLVERVAREFALTRGHDPDAFDMMLICGPNNEPVPCWRAFEEEAENGIRAILETHAIVPREPTHEMILAGCDFSNVNMAGRWRSMLAAAPDVLKEKP